MEAWQLLALVLGPSGAAWVGVKMALNGTREQVKDLKGDIKALSKDVRDNRDHIIRLREHLQK